MKNLLAVLALLISVSCAHAQSEGTSEDKLGFRFGLHFSPELAWLKPQDSKVANASPVKFGFSYGLMFDYNIAQRYAFSTGLYISQMPGTISFKTPQIFNSQVVDSSQMIITFPAGTSVDYKLQYIEVPISLKLRTNEIGYLTYFGQFGVQGGINIKAKGSIKDPSGVYNRVDEDLNKDIALFNLSLLVGAGVEYSLTTNTSAYVALNFVNGFLDVTDNPKTNKSKTILNQFAIRLGVLF